MVKVWILEHLQLLFMSFQYEQTYHFLLEILLPQGHFLEPYKQQLLCPEMENSANQVVYTNLHNSASLKHVA